MRTRPDVQQETLSRRLALVRAETAAESAPDEGAPQESVWWAAHATMPAWPEPEESEAPVVALVPEPGRHAARRPLLGLPRLPESLRGRARLGTSQLTVVVLVLAVALALACWWLARGRATDLSPVSAPTAAASPLVPLVAVDDGAADDGAADDGAARVGAAPSASAATMVTVDVEGKVRRPGIVIVPSGSRVTDALKAAGGVPHRGTLQGLNLAAVLTDGQQIVVGAPATPAPAATGSDTPGATGDGTLVNLNTATSEELDTLPGVGPVTAQSILEWRDQNGGFTSVQELLEVDGIGPATLEKLTPHVTV